MDGVAPLQVSAASDLVWVARVAAEIATLKRIRDARSSDSLASRLFRQAWQCLCRGDKPETVALGVTANALAALRLGGIDTAVLRHAGLSEAETADILRASFDDVADFLPADVGAGLRPHVGGAAAEAPITQEDVPDVVDALIRQPRAGATCPGKPRLMLEPSESHGDHCLAVAVLGVLLCPEYGADVASVFLAGLSHHFHNARLPDSGFAGEVLLGDHLAPILRRLVDESLDTLPSQLAAATREALAQTADAATSQGRAFNAADVIDRLMEVRHFAAVVRFTEAQALDDMQLVHAGPVQEFHYGVMRRTGLLAG